MKNKLLYFILSLLGFGAVSCNHSGEDICEYGSPYAEFEVKGKVTAAEANGAVKGIRVSLSVTDNPDYYFYDDENIAVTDDDGNYSIGLSSIWPTDYRFDLEASDIDGEDNGGHFATETTVIDLKKSDFKGASGSWYFGKAEKDFNFELSLAREDEKSEITE